MNGQNAAEMICENCCLHKPHRSKILARFVVRVATRLLASALRHRRFCASPTLQLPQHFTSTCVSKHRYRTFQRSTVSETGIETVCDRSS